MKVFLALIATFAAGAMTSGFLTALSGHFCFKIARCALYCAWR